MTLHSHDVFPETIYVYGLGFSLARVKIYDTVNAIAKIRYQYQQMPRPLKNNGCKQEFIKSYPSNSKGVTEEINQ